jgi:hypothetical protein
MLFFQKKPEGFVTKYKRNLKFETCFLENSQKAALTKISLANKKKKKRIFSNQMLVRICVIEELF